MDTVVARLARSLEGRYEIQQELGRGGMAVVFLARDLRHDRLVALKVVRPELAGGLTSQRFLREIRLAAQLSHRGVVPLYDSGDADGVLYYVMPFVEGETLRARLLRETRLPVEVAVRLAADVAEGLAYADEMGVTHRDVKPENIMVSRGHAVITDFGIAKAVRESRSASLTDTGMSIGTPAYMSPEQVAGDASVDGRSDQYSLACVLHEMLVGEPPFTGASAQAVFAKHLTEPPPSVRARRAEVSPGLSAAIERALAKTAARRFAGWKEFLDALLLPPADRVLSRPRRTLIFQAIGLLSAVALGWLVLDSGSGAGTAELLALTLPLGAAISGWWSARRRAETHEPLRPFELQASFESGLYGGLIGGALCGLLIAVLYLSEVAIPPWHYAEFFLFGTLAGAVFGATILLGVSWFRRLASEDGVRSGLADFIGAAVGGTMGGVATGVVFALVFAKRPIPSPSAVVMFGAVALIGPAIVMGTLLFDLRGRIRQLGVPFIGGAVVTMFAVVLTVSVFPYERIVQAFWYDSDPAALTVLRISMGGVLVGGMAGMMLGVQAGGTMMLHRAWMKFRSTRHDGGAEHTLGVERRG